MENTKKYISKSLCDYINNPNIHEKDEYQIIDVSTPGYIEILVNNIFLLIPKEKFE